MDSPGLKGFNKLLAAVPVAAENKARLYTLLSGFDRYYHGIDHVALLFDRHLRYACEASMNDPAATRMMASAIAFHDCIYVSSRDDNEERSAQVWLDMSADGGVSVHERAWVADTIRATNDHLGYGQREGFGAVIGSFEALRLWMLDLDLTPFGEEPEVFDRNARLLRAEAPQLDDKTFETGRLNVLRRFAEAPIIYRTPAIAKRFDSPARRNLARHLASGSIE